MFYFFKKPPKADGPHLTTDIHSHLLAQLDDGVKSLQEAEAVIRIFDNMGYRQLITTPHIMSDYYRNDSSTILNGLEELNKYIGERTNVRMGAAAEYYLDEELMRKTEAQEPLLTFGNRYLLFETNFISEPLHLTEFIFKATSSGYKPVLAHPERYQYMTLKKAEDLRDRGVLFQVNSLSFIGYYSAPVQKIACKLVDKGWVEFLGSDCHTLEQAQVLPGVLKNKYYQKALALPLLNHSL